jgi:endoglucanase
MDTMLTMFRELTEAPGVPGQEKAVRKVMQRYLEPLGEVLLDNLGSIACRKVGKLGQEHGPKIMLAGHLDEIGFLVTRITDEGFLKFQALGGWLDQVMLAHRVEVHTNHGPIVGVIGAKPPHILSPEERKKLVEQKDMYIDIGASSKDEAREWGVRPGDMIVPVSPFTVMRNEKLLLAKAWDNRIGCALVIETLRQLAEEHHPNIVYGTATVQEEVGIRGARTATSLVDPDIGFALDVCIAGDTPGVTPDDAAGKIGQGPVLVVYDRTMVPHAGLRNFVIDVAEKENIPMQYDRVMGGTDAGSIHLHNRGVPSLVFGIPTRYIHSHNAILHVDDFTNCVKLLVAIIKHLDADAVRRIKE